MSTPWVFGGAGGIPLGNIIGLNSITAILPLPISLANRPYCAFISTDPKDPVASPTYGPYQCKAPLDFMTFLTFLKKFTITPGLSGSGGPITKDRSDPTGVSGGPYVMQQCMFDGALTGGPLVSYFDPMTSANWIWQVTLSATPLVVSYQNDFYHFMTYQEFDSVNSITYSTNPAFGPLGGSGGVAAGSFTAFGYTFPIFATDPSATPISPTATVVTAW